jgi:hypothetical protein
VAFHLEGDGHWDVQKIPDDILEQLKFSGELVIHGYRCSVFETPDGDQWGQKIPGTPAPKGDEGAAQMAMLYRMAHKIMARKNLEPNIERAVNAMLEELASAEASLDKARQFGRVIRNEHSLEWIADQIDSSHESLEGILVGIRDSLDYITR